MASVYILHSNSLNKFYVGSCLDINIRLEQHLSKDDKTSFTAKASDWTLFFHIAELDYTTARKVEAHIKNMKSSKYIMNLKQYPEIINTLILKYQ